MSEPPRGEAPSRADEIRERLKAGDVAGADVFKAILFDRQISSSAFRLWHVLRDYANRDAQCWPGFRILRREIGGSFSSLTVWIKELQSAGWLKVETRNRSKKQLGQVSVYTILDGNGSAFTLKRSKKCNTRDNSKRSNFRKKALQKSEHSAPKIGAKGNTLKGCSTKEGRVASPSASASAASRGADSSDATAARRKW